ncbi:MAG: ABC transporter permease [Chloroflexi bacterium]|nr:ABC transporter permease [Chloroflexota bacterium]
MSVSESGLKVGARGLRRALKGDVASSILAVIASFLVGALIVLLFGYSPWEAYKALLQGAFGSWYAASQTLANATPLIFTGLAVALAFRGGVFNIGGEGQLYVGGFAAALAGIYLHLPGVFSLLAALAAGALAGALWAFIPAILTGRNPAILVVTTIMMNPIGTLLADYLLRYHFLGPGATTFETAPVAPAAVLPRFSDQSQLSFGILLAIAGIGLVYYLLFHTAWGFELRAVGYNPLAAKYAGMRSFRNTLATMAVSGALSGLAGAVVILGVYQRFVGGFSPGYGWDGIAVALLARNSPFAIILTAGLFGALRAGGINLNMATNLPVDLINVLLGLVICFVAAPDILRFLFSANWRLKRRPSND